MRLHGDREPRQPQQGETGGAGCCSGAANEVWSYGPEVYEICKKYMTIREDLREYTRSVMKEAHEKGSPIMRPCFYTFPEDPECWEITSQYMYGGKYLCCPVLAPGVRSLEVYLPANTSWKELDGGRQHDGGQTIKVDCPLEKMPVFVRQ